MKSGFDFTTRVQSILAGCALLVTTLAPSQSLAAAPVLESFEQIEALCPSIGTIGLEFGAPRAAQDRAELDKIGFEDPSRAFNETMADYTPWSERLYRLSWYSGMEENDSGNSSDWLRRVSLLLEEGGWQFEPDQSDPAPFASSWGSLRYSKNFSVDGKTRDLLIDVQMLGNFALDCTDAELEQLADNEGLGNLEPGSPRPVPLEVAKSDLPDPEACERPDIQDMFSTKEKLEAAGLKLTEIFPTASHGSEIARFGERLRTWLVWKMLRSGQISQDEIWEVEEGLYPDESEERQDDLLGFLEDAAAIMEAQKLGDGKVVCQNFLSMFLKQRVADERQAARWAKLNTALEAEARRRGIALD